MQLAAPLADRCRGAANGGTRSVKTNRMDSADPTADAARYQRRLSDTRPKLGQPATSRKSFASFLSTSVAGFWNKAAEGYSHGSSKSHVRRCTNFCAL
jgi:hypothetical protein